MSSKSISIFLLIFIIQIIASCGNCGPLQDVNISFKDTVVEPYDFSTRKQELVIDSVRKVHFSIFISMAYDLDEIASKMPLGFSSAFAEDCASYTYLFPDPVSHIDLYMINLETDETINAEDFFDYDGLSKDQYFASVQNKEQLSFQFFLKESSFSQIPSTSILVVETFLESGKMFRSETDEIKFFD